MWLSESKRRNEAEICAASVCIVADEDADVIRPANILRVPVGTESQLMLCCTDGSAYFLGTVGGTTPGSLDEGEIYIKTDNAAITIKNSGAVNITGNVNITGSLSVNGVSV